MRADQHPNSNAPTFTVILPTFNRAYILSEAIESVQRQTVSSWELIIVDDGSADKTREIVSRYASADPRIRYVRQDNQGAALARNKGMSIARGDYIAFIDSDDTFAPGHLQIRLQTFVASPEVDFIYGGANIIGDPFVVDKTDPLRLVSLEDAAIQIGGTFALRRSAAAKIGGFADIRYSEDGDFYRRAVSLGLKTFRVAEKTYNYNRNSIDSICTATLKSSKVRRRRSSPSGTPRRRGIFPLTTERSPKPLVHRTPRTRQPAGS